MSSKPTNQSSPEFTSYYLQRATQELSEDLDKQGAGLFSPEDQKRVVAEPKGKEGDA
ncbi:uncharacterized protein B0J16DRAFT_380414 [Fusarium flagelliforme]|uniref:uncharacterized protein n=1 Tax=Fusarium flagelliforme TaxID=2675880 RepID=UPI001E8E76CD|nr:uncharacterized protein B0J16DRAFT_380414 [Fusarium flagelliforme]KAH7192524.1 hypothetical protein B0J16DRAFT_380414 [Fusarium flagelliforme]